jgi:hypothetical protein
MSEDQSNQRTCYVNLFLSTYGGVHTWYDPKAGLRRLLVLTGRVDDPYRSPMGDFFESEPGSAFHGKPVRMEISSPPDEKCSADDLGTLGVENAFGVFSVEAHVELEQFELDGEMVEVEPVRVNVEMNPDAFETIRCQASEAYERRRIMWAKLTLHVGALPELDNSFRRVDLKDLDVSKENSYAVGDFEIFDTSYTDDLRGRVLQVERGRDEGYGTAVSVLLTEARYEIHAERGLLYSISCEGRVTNRWGKPYDGAYVTVELIEHEPNRYDNLFVPLSPVAT